MKTTVELPEELVKRARRTARKEGATLRELIEEGLQHALKVRRKRETKTLDFPSYGGSGMTEDFQHAAWEQIRDEAYRGRGG